MTDGDTLKNIVWAFVFVVAIHGLLLYGVVNLFLTGRTIIERKAQDEDQDHQMIHLAGDRR